METRSHVREQTLPCPEGSTGTSELVRWHERRHESRVTDTDALLRFWAPFVDVEGDKFPSAPK